MQGQIGEQLDCAGLLSPAATAQQPLSSRFDALAVLGSPRHPPAPLARQHTPQEQVRALPLGLRQHARPTCPDSRAACACQCLRALCLSRCSTRRVRLYDHARHCRCSLHARTCRPPWRPSSQSRDPCPARLPGRPCRMRTSRHKPGSPLAAGRHHSPQPGPARPSAGPRPARCAGLSLAPAVRLAACLCVGQVRWP